MVEIARRRLRHAHGGRGRNRQRRPEPGCIRCKGGRWRRVRGRVVSLVRLGDLLSFHRAGGAAATLPNAAETTLVIVGEAGQEVGLAVDRVIGEEDVVIKSIAENYENVPGIAGASILGDGRVSLILDIAGLDRDRYPRKPPRVTC